MAGRNLEMASALIEQVASDNSSSVYVYDLAEHAGFGSLTKELNNSRKGLNVVSLQTRAGAGLSLVGQLSEQGSSKDVDKDSVLTAYTTPTGLAAMVASFGHFPKPVASRRAVFQVPTVSSIGQTLELSPTLASLSPIMATLPDSFAVVLSSAPQESVDIAKAVYGITDSHVIHLFDHYAAGRELGHDLVTPPAVKRGTEAFGVKDALDAAGYTFFDYIGDAGATKVVVALNGSLASTASFFAKDRPGFGVVVVRVLWPWDDTQFLATLPKTARFVHVLDEVPTEGTQGALYGDVFAACLGSKDVKRVVRSSRVMPASMQKFITYPSSFASFLGGLVPPSPPSNNADANIKLKKLLFFGTPSSTLAGLPLHVVNTFTANQNIQSRSLTDYDVFTKPGGLSATRVLLSPKDESKVYAPLHVYLPLGNEEHQEYKADFLAVLDQSLLKSHSIITYLKPNSELLLFSSWSNTEILSNLPKQALDSIRNKHIRVYTVDLKSLEVDASTENVIGHLAFLRLYLGQSANEILLRKLAYSIYGASNAALNIDKLNAKAWSALVEVDLNVQDEPLADETNVDLKPFEFNAISGGVEIEQTSLPGAHISNWHEAARHILFSESFVPADEVSTNEEYPQNPALRPELPERTYLVTCSVNRRLTPLDYDRNVFHLEFDTSGTGLKYAIGEALGVHGWNDADEVLDFCKWYGVDPDRLITLPIPGAEGKVHTRTIFQALQQQIDLFGKPPKGFYSDLSNHATSKNDKLTLQFVGSPEGSAMFKKLSEKETVTFADVLRTYKSARPSIELLCEMIEDIKPRHYSIASAQSVVGNRVDLLVVTVEWATPSGSPRYGQCTRYLAGLKVGQKVTVSIKPSVMKLPPSDLQPLILAGLGTGAAPFRAFLQHRALLASQGKPVGPLFYYFGSRYRSKEYLYGEEIEAFILDKTITRAGLAFSRDGPRKVYIQHKMLEDAEALVRMLHRENGVFYLCGPTWPVPDVYETLVKALVKYNGLGETEAGEYIEGLKEEERYVLEVY